MQQPSEVKLKKTELSTNNIAQKKLTYEPINKLYSSLTKSLSEDFSQLNEKKMQLPWQELRTILAQTIRHLLKNNSESKIPLLEKKHQSFYLDADKQDSESTVAAIQQKLRANIKIIKNSQKKFSPIGWQEKSKLVILPLSIAVAIYVGTVGVGASVSGNSFLNVMKSTPFCTIPIFFALTASLLAFFLQRHYYLVKRGIKNGGLKSMFALNSEYLAYQATTNDIIQKIQCCIGSIQNDILRKPPLDKEHSEIIEEIEEEVSVVLQPKVAWGEEP